MIDVIHDCGGNACLTCFMAERDYVRSYAAFWFKPNEPKAKLMSDQEAHDYKCWFDWHEGKSKDNGDYADLPLFAGVE